MSATGYRSFDTTVQKTDAILKEIEQEFGWPKERRNQSYAALRATLHALRDRLTVEEAAQFSAQLTMLVRGIYFEGWDPTGKPETMGLEEFLEAVRKEFTFELDGDIDLVPQAVFLALSRNVDEGEWSDVKSTMPKKLASLLP
ncbi:MAG: hypothetical protein JWN35_240 [Frankiales bacterium]|jgi:uncharacterized protein (DUF2267 family)|nr:hypothetical protein [Frankiales bacterium]